MLQTLKYSKTAGIKGPRWLHSLFLPFSMYAISDPYGYTHIIAYSVNFSSSYIYYTVVGGYGTVFEIFHRALCSPICSTVFSLYSFYCHTHHGSLVSTSFIFHFLSFKIFFLPQGGGSRVCLSQK